MTSARGLVTYTVSAEFFKRLGEFSNIRFVGDVLARERPMKKSKYVYIVFDQFDVTCFLTRREARAGKKRWLDYNKKYGLDNPVYGPFKYVAADACPTR